jgi:hypothetical protein
MSYYTEHKKNIMLDLETLSVTPDAVVLSMAAVEFYPFEDMDTRNPRPVESFSILIDVDTQDNRAISDDTMAWWARQDQAVQDLMFSPDNRIDLSAGLDKLAKFVQGKDRIWSQGSFDINILEHAYRQYGKPTPWNFWQISDSRSVIDLSKVDMPPATHDPLDDCRRQVLGLKQVFKNLGVTSFSR